LKPAQIRGDFPCVVMESKGRPDTDTRPSKEMAIGTGDYCLGVLQMERNLTEQWEVSKEGHSDWMILGRHEEYTISSG